MSLREKVEQLTKLNLTYDDQLAFIELVSKLIELGLPHNLPRFWPAYAGQYGYLPNQPSFETWFYWKISMDGKEFLVEFWERLQFVESYFSVMASFIKQQPLFYIFCKN